MRKLIQLKNIFSAVCAVVLSWVVCIFSVSAMAENVEISAKSAVVIDRLTGRVLFARNADQKLPMASTTKIMSAILALEHGNLDEVFTVDSRAIKVEGSSMGLKEGDRVTMRDLCCGMLLPSGNDAANAAAVRISGSVEKFVALMNEKAKKLGLRSTHFVTPSGLDDFTDEHYSTARDMAKLTAYAMKNKDFRKIVKCKTIKLKFGNPPYERWLVNSNKLLKNYSDCIGVKTGFTDKAKRCLVSAWSENGSELICVTLNAPNDWEDHRKLVDISVKLYQNQRVDGKSMHLNVAGGIYDSVRCEYSGEKFFLPQGEVKNVTVKLYLPPFVYAPVKCGEKAGKAFFYLHGEKIGEKDIIITENCGYYHVQKHGFDRILDIIGI